LIYLPYVVRRTLRSSRRVSFWLRVSGSLARTAARAGPDPSGTAPARLPKSRQSPRTNRKTRKRAEFLLQNKHIPLASNAVAVRHGKTPAYLVWIMIA
jgi:hypothetical protein